MREFAPGAIQKIETLLGPYPQMSRMVLENGPHFVAGERSGALCVVAEALDELTRRVDVVEAAVERADPQAPGVILDHRQDLFARESAAILAKVQESVAFGLPAI